MINEREYEAMKKLISKHDSRINALYRLTSFSEIMILFVLLVSLYPFYVTFGLAYTIVIFIVLFAVSCIISHMIQRDTR